MPIENRLVAYAVLAMLVALVISFLATPVVKTFAYKVGAIDVPKDARRMHKVPIPRLGGLAIFIGFIASILLFVPITPDMRSMLLGAVIIVVLGVVDDIMALPAMLKFVVQIVAAAIPVCVGDLQIKLFTNLNPFSDTPYFHLGILAMPITIIWIVGITNAVNLIDGLDGLAGGLSAIAFFAFGIITWGADWASGNEAIAIFCFVLVGSLVGFLFYNCYPAKIFMGDTGSLSLGAALASVAIITNHEITLIIVAGVFVIETLSVIVQWIAISKFHTKVLLMAPLHHHFEKLGWSETDVVRLFWSAGLLLSMAAIGFGVWI